MTELDKADLAALMKLPPFRRFLFRAIQNVGIYAATANAADGRHLYLEGRRSVGLDILRDVEAAMPVQHPSGIPILTLLQILREVADTPQEKPNGRRTDQYRELNDGNDRGDDHDAGE